MLNWPELCRPVERLHCKCSSYARRHRCKICCWICPLSQWPPGARSEMVGWDEIRSEEKEYLETHAGQILRILYWNMAVATFLKAIAVAVPGETAMPSWNGNGCCLPSTITTLTPASSLNSGMYSCCSIKRSNVRPEEIVPLMLKLN